jgi:hypothetical protein
MRSWESLRPAQRSRASGPTVTKVSEGLATKGEEELTNKVKPLVIVSRSGPPDPALGWTGYPAKLVLDIRSSWTIVVLGLDPSQWTRGSSPRVAMRSTGSLFFDGRY